MFWRKAKPNPEIYCSFYLRKGVAYIPTMAKTEAGFWLESEPVRVVAVSTPEQLCEALLSVACRGNPVVPTPTRDAFPRPVIEKHCGMASLSAFERSADHWSFFASPNHNEVTRWKRQRYGGWLPDEQPEAPPPGTSTEEVVLAVSHYALASSAEGFETVSCQG